MLSAFSSFVCCRCRCLIAKIEPWLSNCMVRAFADDTAMVLSNFNSQASDVMRLFRQYGFFFGLHLNMLKTLVMPLWSFSSASFIGFLKDTFPEWSRATVSSFGKYLGLMVGPCKNLPHGTFQSQNTRNVVYSGRLCRLDCSVAVRIIQHLLHPS